MSTPLPPCCYCQSLQVIRHGYSRYGKQRYKCRACGRGSTHQPSTSAYDEATKAQILRAYHERTSLRGLTRIFGVSRQTVIAWLKKVLTLQPLEQTLLPARHPLLQEGVELDEVWSFVGQRRHKRWVWFALCRRTRQVVAYAMGPRDDATCRQLWLRIPERYRFGLLYTDFWSSYHQVLPVCQHCPHGKEMGDTNHLERFNLTLRQRLGRFVRKTLSFLTWRGKSASTWLKVVLTHWHIGWPRASSQGASRRLESCLRCERSTISPASYSRSSSW